MSIWLAHDNHTFTRLMGDLTADTEIIDQKWKPYSDIYTRGYTPELTASCGQDKELLLRKYAEWLTVMRTNRDLLAASLGIAALEGK